MSIRRWIQSRVDKIEAGIAACYRCWLVKWWQAIRDCRRAHLFDDYDNPGKLPWELMGFILIVLCIPCTFVCSAAKADRTQPLLPPVFHSWQSTDAHIPQFLLMSSLWKTKYWHLVNKHSTWAFPFKALKYLSHNCKYWIKILSTVSPKMPESLNVTTPRSQVTSCRVHGQLHSQWREQKKLVIMRNST